MTISQDKISIPGLPDPIYRIALGTWAIGGAMWGGTDEAQAVKTIRRALDLGINLIDTAPVYGFGHSEEVVGKALSAASAKPHVATKVGLSWKDGKVYRDSRPEAVRKGVEDSLRRLGVETLSLVQVHWPDAHTPLEETARELDRLQKEGKILAIGVSNFSVQQIETFGKYAKIATTQDPLNLFERASEKTLLPYAEAHKMVFLAYGALCRGLLGGKMDKNTTFPRDDLRSGDPKFRMPEFQHYLDAVEALKQLKDNSKVTVLSLAVRWIMAQGPTIALWGARKPEQLDHIKDVFDWPLTPQILAEVDAILNRCVPRDIEPVFMAPPERTADAAL